MGSEIIEKYFTELDETQKQRFSAMYSLYEEWNAKINVVSRKDFDQLYIRHILHSLAIAKVCSFGKGARILDVGTGGGFPGIPLAVMFPQAHFTLSDSIGKKITVVRSVAEGLGLANITAVNARAENIPGKFDYVVSRAVTEMTALMGWVWGKVVPGQSGTLPNGILCLKGGDLEQELKATGKNYTIYPISDFFGEEFFDTKKVVYIRK